VRELVFNMCDSNMHGERIKIRNWLLQELSRTVLEICNAEFLGVRRQTSDHSTGR
jgi:hypothetical protein